MTLTSEAKSHLRHVQLNLWERQFLEFVADRTGRVRFDYGLVKMPVKLAIGALKMKGLMRENPHETAGKNVAWLSLTDEGRAVVDYLKGMHVG